jgi:hypothetical protein
MILMGGLGVWPRLGGYKVCVNGDESVAEVG